VGAFQLGGNAAPGGSVIRSAAGHRLPLRRAERENAPRQSSETILRFLVERTAETAVAVVKSTQRLPDWAAHGEMVDRTTAALRDHSTVGDCEYDSCMVVTEVIDCP
jgi:hypothetical protein